MKRLCIEWAKDQIRKPPSANEEESYFFMFSENISISIRTCLSYASPSLHAFRGSNDSVMLSHRVHTSKPNNGSVLKVPFNIVSSQIAEISARLFLSEILLPVRKSPPIQPVFINHTCAPLFCIFFSNSCAYTSGLSGKNTSPKHAENVATGVVIPTSVLGTLEV